MQIIDSRDDQSNRNGPWMCATDTFMSGLLNVVCISYVAYDLSKLTDRQIKNLTEWMERRPDYIRVRFNLHLPRGTAQDHLSIMDPPLHRIQ